MHEADNSKFVIRKSIIVNDNPKVNHNAGNEINYNTEVWKSNLHGYSDAYILVRGGITANVQFNRI